VQSVKTKRGIASYALSLLPVLPLNPAKIRFPVSGRVNLILRDDILDLAILRFMTTNFGQ
jgi:hypothetical protein